MIHKKSQQSAGKELTYWFSLVLLNFVYRFYIIFPSDVYDRMCLTILPVLQHCLYIQCKKAMQ